MTGRKVKIKITETFEKEVEVTVPSELKSDKLIERWVNENIPYQVLDAMSVAGVNEIESDMDYTKTIKYMKTKEVTE